MARLDYWECARQWAWQTEQSGETRERRMFFEGPVIYSYGYHWPIACITDKRVRGQQVVLFCWVRRSNTTSKHTHEVDLALRRRGGFKVISVENPKADTGLHRANLRWWKERYHSALLRASRARLVSRDVGIAQAEIMRDEANEYARLFGVGRWWIRKADPQKLRKEELKKRQVKMPGLFNDG